MPGEAVHATTGLTLLALSQGHGMLYSARVAQHIHVMDGSCTKCGRYQKMCTTAKPALSAALKKSLITLDERFSIAM